MYCKYKDFLTASVAKCLLASFTENAFPPHPPTPISESVIFVIYT